MRGQKGRRREKEKMWNPDHSDGWEGGCWLMDTLPREHDLKQEKQAHWMAGVNMGGLWNLFSKFDFCFCFSPYK